MKKTLEKLKKTLKIPKHGKNKKRKKRFYIYDLIHPECMWITVFIAYDERCWLVSSYGDGAECSVWRFLFSYCHCCAVYGYYIRLLQQSINKRFCFKYARLVLLGY